MFISAHNGVIWEFFSRSPFNLPSFHYHPLSLSLSLSLSLFLILAFSCSTLDTCYDRMSGASTFSFSAQLMLTTVASFAIEMLNYYRILSILEGTTAPRIHQWLKAKVHISRCPFLHGQTRLLSLFSKYKSVYQMSRWQCKTSPSSFTRWLTVLYRREKEKERKRERERERERERQV